VLGAAACFPISERSVAPSILVVVRYLYSRSDEPRTDPVLASQKRVLSRRLRGREEGIASVLVLPPINREEAIASFAPFFSLFCFARTLARKARSFVYVGSDPRSLCSLVRPRFARTLARIARSLVYVVARTRRDAVGERSSPSLRPPKEQASLQVAPSATLAKQRSRSPRRISSST
jgi:hypothetical protein